jgi:hypothetical protein
MNLTPGWAKLRRVAGSRPTGRHANGCRRETQHSDETAIEANPTARASTFWSFRLASSDLGTGRNLRPRREMTMSRSVANAGRRPSPKVRTIAFMCWTLLTLGLFTGTAVLWRGGSTHSRGLEISGVVLLLAAVIAGAQFG